MRKSHFIFILFYSSCNPLSRYIKHFSIIFPHMTKQADLRRLVYALVGQMSKAHLVKHFQVENIPRSTTYRIIKRFEDGLPHENKARKGRSSKLNKQQQQKLKDCTENTVGVGSRKLASKFNVSRSWIRRNLKKLGLKYYKRQRAPKYNQQQLEHMPNKCRKLRRSSAKQGKFIVIDDEKYFTFSGGNMPGNAGFYSCNKQTSPPDVRFKCKRKFAPKVLVWLTLSSIGVSVPYIGKTKDPAINANVYYQKCLPRLLEFINKHHLQNEFNFLAGPCHVSLCKNNNRLA